MLRKVSVLYSSSLAGAGGLPALPRAWLLGAWVVPTQCQGLCPPAAQTVRTFLASTGKGNAIYFYIVYILSWSAESYFTESDTYLNS